MNLIMVDTCMYNAGSAKFLDVWSKVVKLGQCLLGVLLSSRFSM